MTTAPAATPERVTLLADALPQATLTPPSTPTGRPEHLSWDALAERLLSTPAMRALLDPQPPEPVPPAIPAARPTAEQWLARLDAAPYAQRVTRIRGLLSAANEAGRCFEENHDGRLAATDAVRCSRCGECVSNDVPGRLVVRAFIECPECVAARAKDAPEWTDEYRVAGMGYRTASGRRTENSTVVTAPDPFDRDEALDLMRDLQGSRGGIVEHRRVAVTEWEPVPDAEPEAAAPEADQ